MHKLEIERHKRDIAALSHFEAAKLWRLLLRRIFIYIQIYLRYFRLGLLHWVE